VWYVGTSGWQYASWRGGAWYPEGMAQSRWLEYYVTRFPTVEVNNTFYRLPSRDAFAGWARRTPDGFVLTCKLSRYLSHVRRLRDPKPSVELFLDRAEPLRAAGRLGPLLLQLPPTLKADPPNLAAVIAAIPDDLRLAVEFRHDSWFTDDVLDLLRRHDVALCLADRRSRMVGPFERTAGWAYLRMHEGTADPRPCYGDDALRSWVERLLERWGPEADVFVYFNNDPRACAPANAERFADLATREGARVAKPLSPARG
jgi:uncharacterized protein YecE (DUF72 family)